MAAARFSLLPYPLEVPMWKQIRWLWDNMDAKYHVRHIIALSISVFTCLLLPCPSGSSTTSSWPRIPIPCWGS